MTSEQRTHLHAQILSAESSLRWIAEISDWLLLGVKWNSDASCRAHLEHDARGNTFTTCSMLHQAPRTFTDARGRTRTEDRPRTTFACRNCGVAVEWRKNQAGKSYLASVSVSRGFHTCLSEAKAWYQLQHDALTRATEWCEQRNLEVSAANLAAAVNPVKAGA